MLLSLMHKLGFARFCEWQTQLESEPNSVLRYTPCKFINEGEGWIRGNLSKLDFGVFSSSYTQLKQRVN